GYLSTTSHQINERMKVLTMVSTIFIPLTFIAGIYGMNFIYMPELQMANGYYAVLATMLAGGIAGLLWFKMRGWWYLLVPRRLITAITVVFSTRYGRITDLIFP